MSVLGLLLVLSGGLPLLCGLVLLVRKRRLQGRATRARHEHSVFAIAARIARERERREPPVRWPRVDPDRGVIRDNRPTELLPLAERLARPTARRRHRAACRPADS